MVDHMCIQFSFRSLAPQGYAICYVASEGRQKDGAKAGGGPCARRSGRAGPHTARRAARTAESGRGYMLMG